MVGPTESGKDLAQAMVVSAATRVGNIAGIITTAVGAVATEIGELVTDAFEMNEARKAAEKDNDGDAEQES